MLSIAYLDKLWSQAVREKAGHRCAWCGVTEGLQAHHVVHRRQNAILRHHIANGLCLCGECHRGADTATGRLRAYGMIDIDLIRHIETEYKFKADFKSKLGLSEAEYRESVANNLKKIIKGEA